MVRRLAACGVLALILASASPAGAIDLLPVDVSIEGPTTLAVGDPGVYTGEVTLLALPVPPTMVELYVNATPAGSAMTDLTGGYSIPHAFLASGLYMVQAKVDGVFVGASPVLEVRVGTKLLTVTKAGTGLGTVTSVPAGIDCGLDCTEAFAFGTSVDLSALPAAGNAFSGWSGACTGTGGCTLAMTGARTVVASFGDTAPPGVPVLTGSTPASPGNDNTPTLHGNAQDGSTVNLFTNASCAGAPAATGTASGGAFSIDGSVADNTTTTFHANATDAGGTGGCSSGLTYVEDSAAPPPPVLTATSPASPANDNDPLVLGTADAGSLVRLYTNATCSSAVAGSGQSFSGSFAIEVTVANNTTTTFHGRATDAAGNTSACSAGLTYVEDSLAPTPPTLTGTTPSSPANNQAPTVHGTAEPDALIYLYANSPCTGPLAGVATASGVGTFSILVSVPNDSVTIFRATARDAAYNTSACSAGITYVEDSSAPSSPSITGSIPSSPANNNSPSIIGVSEPGSTVRLFTDSSCAGAPVATGVATGGGTFSITVAVADDSTTTFYAKSEDSVGNISSCSAGFTYVEDSTPPGPVILTGFVPASPANENMPHLHGFAEPGAQVRVFTNASCSGAPPWGDMANPATGGAFSTQVLVPDDSSTTFYAHAIDAAGNVGPCSAGITYVEDSTPPPAPVLTGTSPASPANDNNPSILGTSEAGTTVTLFTTSTCTGVVAGTGPAPAGAFTIAVTVADDTTTTFFAKATDAAGNTGPCSTGLTYIEDTTVAPPTILGSLPESPANNNSPSIYGLTEPGATVALYTNSTCTSAVAGSGVATPSGSFSIVVSVPDNSSTTFHGIATDVVLNVSSCSSGFTYVEDSTPPGPPFLTMTTPPSGSNDNAPRVHGFAEGGAMVWVFSNATCSGIPEWADRANAATGGAFSVQVKVADNSTTSFSAVAEDRAGNVSGCSNTISYTEVST